MPPRKDTSNDDQPTSFQDQLSALNAKVDALVTALTNPFKPDRRHNTHPVCPPPNNPLHKSPKILLPTFDGTSPLDWLFQADQYFTFYNIPLEQRVALASFHFQGDALSWYKYMHNNQLLGDWETFTRALELRFGPSSFENHQAALFKLKQTSSVAAFQTEFERLSNCVVGLPTTALLNCFISGLRSDIQQEIAVYKPTTLHQTYGLSKLIEDKLAANESQVASSSRPPFISHTTQTTTIQPTLTPPAILPNPAKQTTPLPTRRLSPEEMQTRRSQGLCFRCPERFYPGHRCNPPQFLLLGNDEPLPLTSDIEAQTNLEEYSGDIQPHQFLALSAAALHGTTCPLAIRITGHINGHTVTVLVDSGSSHNIIKPCLVSLLHLPFDSQPSFPVMIGNGTFLHCTGQCPNIDLRLSNTPFSISPYVFPIEGADVVLGMSWLSALGPVKADFSVPQLTFNHLDKQVTLRGESSPKSGTITDLEDKVVVHPGGIDTNMIEPVKAKAGPNQEH
ncbi:ty3-gypsy retrotransposon protein [Tanacetum coccineum]